MANEYKLLDLQALLRAIGRGVVFYADKWDGQTDLELTHLGDTEGEITAEMNASYSHLTLPELTGEAKHRSYVNGEDPVVTIPLYLADPALRAIISPTGSASGGHQRQRPVTERTVVIFPEELFFDEAAGAYGDLAYTDSDGWQVNGTALTPRQEALLGMSVWFWRGYFDRPGLAYRHEDGGKLVEPATFQVMQSDLAIGMIPDGHRLYTVGDPADAAIDIAPGVP